MKHIYIDSRVTPLLLDAAVFIKPRTQIFSQGKPWLLLTPSRFEQLIDRLGTRDNRIGLLMRVIRRHARDPARFCRSAHAETPERRALGEYPPVLCPGCDGVHSPHPEDAGEVCDSCRELLRKTRQAAFAGGRTRDKRMNILARERLFELEPSLFRDGCLMPNHQFNAARRLARDWDAAVNQILHGRPYKQVAAEYDCSVGLLHKVVKERYWESN
jgi:hypothetical protein